jgi:hypothetical protein
VPAPPPLLNRARQRVLGCREILCRNIQLSDRVGLLLDLLHFHLRGLRYGNRNLVLARHFRLTRRLLHPVAAATTAAAGSGLTQPDDVRVGLVGQHGRGYHSGAAESHAEEDDQGQRDVRDQGARERRRNALLLLFKKERDLDWMGSLDVNRQMTRRFVWADFERRGFGHRECYWAR